MSKKKSLLEKAAEVVDQVIHPDQSSNETPAEDPKDSSADEAESNIQPMAKKKKTAPSEMGEHKKFDKFNQGSDQ